MLIKNRPEHTKSTRSPGIRDIAKLLAKRC
jgi:hypothetical protein